MFDQSLDGIQLPSSLQNLTIGDEFNQSLEAIHLPSSLQSLEFGCHFDQSLEGIELPSSLQRLKFSQTLEGIQATQQSAKCHFTEFLCSHVVSSDVLETGSNAAAVRRRHGNWHQRRRCFMIFVGSLPQPECSRRVP